MINFYCKFFVLVTVLCLSVTAQEYYGNYYIGHLNVVEVEDSTLTTIIDSLISFEKQCKYFKPNLNFSIFLHSDSFVAIESMNHKIVESAVNLGCFKYRGHLFVVGGRELNINIFAFTDRKIEITYYEPTDKDIFQEDDSYTAWHYKYINDQNFPYFF